MVGRASAAVDVLFAAFHFGESLDRTLTVPQITLARRAIEAGADAVIGSHPHVLQAIEIYGSAPIFYSLGHLVFDSITEFGFPYPADKMFPPASAASGLVNFTISSGTITAVSLRPTIIDHENTPRLIHESDAAFESHVQPVVSQSRERGTRIDLDDQTLRIQLE